MICDFPQRADKPAVTSFKRWRWGWGGVCFLSFSCCHGYSRVCVPSHALSKQSHSHLHPICHPFSLSDTYCDKMHCMVDWWNVVWRVKSPRRSCDCVSDLTTLIDADWNRLLRSFPTNSIGVESHQCMLHYQGKEQHKEAPLQHLRLQNNPAVEECQINVSPVQVRHLLVIFWMQVLTSIFFLV